MSIRRTLIASSCCVIGVLLAGAILPLLELRRVRAESQAMVAAEAQMQTALRIHRELLPYRDRLQRAAGFKDADAVAAASAALQEALDRSTWQMERDLQRPGGGNPTYAMLLESTAVHLGRTLPAQLDDVVLLARAGDWTAVQGRLDQQIATLIQRTADFVAQVQDVNQKERGAVIERMQQRQAFALQILLCAVLLTVALAAGAGTLLIRRIGRSLAPLGEGAAALARGDFQRRVPELPDSELAPLAAAFNYAAGQLHTLYAALRDSETRFRSLFESAPIPYMEVAPDGAILRINRVGSELLGHTVASLAQCSLWDFVPAADLEAVRSVWVQLASGSRPAPGFPELHFLSSRGEQVPVEVFASTIEGAAGQTAAIRLAIMDVSERTRLENELNHAQKMEAIGRLAGGVAHDFNNSLTVISGWTEVLLQECPEDSPTRERLTEIAKAGAQAASLTRQLLAFSRKQVVQPVALDLNAAIRDADKLLRRLVGEDIALVTQLDCSDAQVLADPGQIHQVIANLVVNARDAMPQGGTITLETADVTLERADPALPPGSPPGPYVRFSITDTGIGMDEQTRGRIFEPFFTTKSLGHGTGLGLSTVYGVVRQVGGWIDVESTPGQGTRFRAYFPRLAEGGAVAARKQQEVVRTGRGETVLLVEDQEEVRALVGTMLHDLGYAVVSTGDPRQAEALMRERHVDLLLTDIVMPGLSGPELAEHMRGLDPALKVLFMSGYYDDTKLPRNPAEYGAEMLLKPFSKQVLGTKVHSTLHPESRPHGATEP